MEEVKTSTSDLALQKLEQITGQKFGNSGEKWCKGSCCYSKDAINLSMFADGRREAGERE